MVRNLLSSGEVAPERKAMSKDQKTRQRPQVQDIEAHVSTMPGLTSVYLGNTAEMPALDDEQMAAGPAQVRNIPFLRVIHPREFTQRIRLDEGSIVIGRGEQADVALNDNQISRLHCRIMHSGGKIFVEDLGSTNGTFLDGRAVKLDSMTIHSRLQIGRFVLKAEFKDPDEIRYDDRILAAATTDGLTGLPNRQWLMDQGVMFVKAFSEKRRLLSAVMIDIDHFKQVNDRLGHPAGDRVLQEVAGVLHANKRELDLLGRFGGEEFLMFLPHTQLQEARTVCERICTSVARHRFAVGEEGALGVSVSIGVASQRIDDNTSIEDLIGRADRALYQAKREGRNRVVVAP